MASNQQYDHLIKLLLIGDSGVGKSCLLLRFSDDQFTTSFITTIGIDFKIRTVELDGKRVKLQIWDTAGQERFRTLTSSYYRGAQGIVFVYDITRRDTFDDLAEIWQREVDMYSTVEDCVKIVIGNKVDRAEQRAVSREEGMAFARDNGCLFLECSAKTKVSVQEAFEELVRGVLETPSLLAETAAGDGRVRLKQYQARKGACAC